MPLALTLGSLALGGRRGGRGFTGPLDGFPQPAFAVSLRRLLRAWKGAAIRVRESGGDTEADIGFAADGSLDEAALVAHCGANSGYVKTWYDQSGHGRDATQATSAQQMRVVASGVIDKIGDQPFAISPNSTARGPYPTATFTAYTGTTITFSAVAVPAILNQRIISATKNTVDDYAASSNIIPFNTSTNLAIYRAGNIVVVNTDITQLHTLGARLSGATAYLTVDGSTTSAAHTAALDINRFIVGGYSNTGAGFFQGGKMSEAIAWLEDIGA